MKTLLFLVIVLVSGFSAGIIHGLINLVVIEPFLDKAIGIENQNLFATGQAQDTPQFWEEFNTYRVWQKQGEVIAGGILGLSMGALFGLVFAYSRPALPSQNHIKKALFLAGIMWFTIFFIPFLKYPANPPTVGDPQTIVIRTTLYVAFVALSALGALGFSRVYNKVRIPSKKIIVPLVYAIYISVIFIIFPENPDQVIAPEDLINGFRIASASTVTMFWVLNAIILGTLWQKFQPHIEKNQFQ
ncbi:MAG TPA: CbtA family protein [Nitrosopumilaceae archaeon]|nr:CbtA family protein [Nitrosopumilaceae archaeon]